MKSITCFNDITPYGIDLLTGEADALQFRILCGLTAAGKKIVEKCLGLPEIPLHEPWNQRTSTGEPAVGCIMLAREMLVPLAIFALLENGCREVYLYDNGSVYGVENDDTAEDVEGWLRFLRDKPMRRMSYRNVDGVSVGDRNIHQRSRRVE